MDIRIKNNSHFILSILLLLSSCSVGKTSGNKINLDNGKQQLKDYALCKCLSLDDSSESMDDGSIAAYFSMSDYGTEAFEEIRSFIDVYLKKNNLQSKYENRSLHRMECIQMYNSIELENLILKIEK